MKKLIFSVMAIIAVALSTLASAAQPAKAVSTAKADWFTYEAMWIAGGPGYQAAVQRLAGVYAQKMNKHCKASIDVADVAKAYRVAIPKGAEAIRDVYIAKQIATLACITMHGERHAIAERML